MTAKTRTYIIIAAALLCFGAIVCILTLSPKDSYSLKGREIRCCIALGKSDDQTTALLSGYNYELLSGFASENGSTIAFVPIRDTSFKAIDSLVAGKLDILVLPATDSIPPQVTRSVVIDSSFVWLLREDRKLAMAEVDAWLGEYLASEAHTGAKTRFYSAVHDPIRLANAGKRRTFISPYDSLFVRYAPVVGWDWRLLAAVAFKESKFRIDALSHKNAYGLMQMTQDTAEKHGVTEDMDPENNIRAGADYLKRLKRIFAGKTTDSAELTRFVLGAYNGGEGRILEYIDAASSAGLFDSTWTSIRKLPQGLDSLSVDGERAEINKTTHERVVAYVDEVLDIYGAFRSICP